MVVFAIGLFESKLAHQVMQGLRKPRLPGATFSSASSAQADSRRESSIVNRNGSHRFATHRQSSTYNLSNGDERLMKAWIELQLPEISNIRGFAFPIGDRMVVRTADGLHCLELVPSIRWRKVMTDREVDAIDNGDSWGKERSQKLTWDGDKWFLHGFDCGDVTLCDLSTGERIELDENDVNMMLLKDARTDTIVQRIAFPLADENSSDFSIAGFSVDEQFLILCTSCKLRVFRRDN